MRVVLCMYYVSVLYFNYYFLDACFYSIKKFNRLIFQTSIQLKIRSLSNFTGSLLRVCDTSHVFAFFI